MREEADPSLINSSKVGVRKFPPALSIVCEKHPISKTLGYKTFMVRMATSLVEALSRMDANTRSTEIPYSTESVDYFSRDFFTTHRLSEQLETY